MVEVELGAEPDEWELLVAEALSSHGCNVLFRKRSLFDYDRRCDSLLNNVRWELKNPRGNGFLTVHNQLLNNLYGQDKHFLNPQSSRVVISNVRSDMSIEFMQESLERALSGRSGLSNTELACIHEVVLVDYESKGVCGYVKSRQVSPESLSGSLSARYDYTTSAQRLFGASRARFGDLHV